MIDFLSIKKNLKKDCSRFKSMNVTVMGDTPTQLFCMALKGMGVEYSINLNIKEAGYNQIDQILFSSENNDLLTNVDVVIVFESSHKLLQRFNKIDSYKRLSFADEVIARVKQTINMLQSKTNAAIIYCNFVELDDCVFGQYANKVEESFLYQLRKTNYLLQDFAAPTSGLYICDLSSVQNQIGRIRFWDAPVYANTEIVVSLDALPYVANAMVKILTTLQGRVFKCIILDLDNTLWGGVIGDDGLENIQLGNYGIGKVFSEFQFWLKKLQQRGVILAVCSKNNDAVAKAPFINHPDMVLRLSDIAIFVANWESKPENIMKIKDTLNISYDSIVFLDDNPYERAIVKQSIPEMMVPDLPQDPALFLDYLYSLNLFETVSHVKEDLNRTQYYKSKEDFNASLQTYSDVNDFLSSIDMTATVKPFDLFTIPRVAQLSQRSNQFNFRTVRYTDEQLHNIVRSENYFTISYTLEDKFGDNGIVSAVILKKSEKATLFIDSWFMSCRVFKRGLEDFIMNTIVDLAKNHGFTTIQGEYIPTEKNVIVKDLFDYFGFQSQDRISWYCNVNEYKYKQNQVKLK